MAKNCICGGGFTYSFPDACDCYKCCADVGLPIIADSKIIRSFDLDLSDLPATSERRRFNISGSKGAEFKLEIKDNTTGYYYNFVTNAFQATKTSLEEIIK